MNPEIMRGMVNRWVHSDIPEENMMGVWINALLANAPNDKVIDIVRGVMARIEFAVGEFSREWTYINDGE